jgi:hypothetical protein
MQQAHAPVPHPAGAAGGTRPGLGKQEATGAASSALSGPTLHDMQAPGARSPDDEDITVVAAAPKRPTAPKPGEDSIDAALNELEQEN